MAWTRLMGMAVVGAMVWSAPAQALVLCAKKKGTTVKPGAPLRIRTVCAGSEISVDPDALGLRGPIGPTGSDGAMGPQGPVGPSGPRLVSLPIESATLLGSNATYELNGGGNLTGIAFPDAGFPRFGVGFTLPPDFVTGTDILVRIVWGNSRFNATSCGFRLESNGVLVHRPGGPGRTAAATFPGGDFGIVLQAPSTTEQVSETTMTIAGTAPGTGSLQAGDMLSIFVNRRPSEIPDTCTGTLFILGLAASW